MTLFDGRAGSTHDVRALLSVTFDSARDADDYAVKMAKTWIEDKDYRPFGCVEPSVTSSRLFLLEGANRT